MWFYWVLATLAATPWCRAESVNENEAWAMIQVNKDNQTALQTIYAPPWVSAAEFRGTMNILQTCVLTLFACIYTALHLNVPPKTDFLSSLITKTKWVLMALFAPEIVLYMAADQLAQALRLKKELKALQEKDTQVDKNFDFNLRYAFFVVMGGVRIPPEEIAKFGYPPPLWEAVGRDGPTHLTPNGVIELAQRGHWIYIKPERIAAKSQANLLQKALVLLQVSYMATTCISRRAYGLPLTLLEIHTMVHVICAIALYGLWFEKPLDISEAEVVYDVKWDGALAVFIQRWCYFHECCNFFVQTTTPSPRRSSSTPPRLTPRTSSTRNTLPSHQLNEASADEGPVPHDFPVVRLPATDSFPSGGVCVGNWNFWFSTKPSSPTLNYKPDRETLARWTAVASDLDAEHAEHPRPEELINLLHPTGVLAPDPLSRARNMHFSSSSALVDMLEMVDVVLDEPFLVLLAAALPAVYGGVHLTAWNFEFPTSVEQLLWKIMCFIIIGAVPVMVSTFAVVLPFVVWDRIKLPWDLAEGFYKLLGIVVLAAYGCARLFLVVESFVSLRRVPIGAYYTPPWLQMIPHA